MVLPETVPVYVTVPTAPKLIALPVTVPVMARVLAGDESTMLPVKVELDWFHVSEKVPVYTPLYVPDHFPERTTAAGAAVGVAVGVGVGTGVLVAGTLVGVGVPVVDDALQAASSDTRAIAVNITMVRFISEVLPLVQLRASYCYTWLILPWVVTIDRRRWCEVTL
jgi:hypothetical protein